MKTPDFFKRTIRKEFIRLNLEAKVLLDDGALYVLVWDDIK